MGRTYSKHHPRDSTFVADIKLDVAVVGVLQVAVITAATNDAPARCQIVLAQKATDTLTGTRDDHYSTLDLHSQLPQCIALETGCHGTGFASGILRVHRPRRWLCSLTRESFVPLLG